MKVLARLAPAVGWERRICRGPPSLACGWPCPYSHGILPAYVFTSIFPLFIRTLVLLHWWPTLLHYDLILMNYLRNDLMAKSGHMLRYSGLGLWQVTALGLGPGPWSMSCGRDNGALSREVSFTLDLRLLS